MGPAPTLEWATSIHTQKVKEGRTEWFYPFFDYRGLTMKIFRSVPDKFNLN